MLSELQRYSFPLHSLQRFLNSGNMTEAGPADLIDDNSDSDTDHRKTLPGVTVGKLQVSCCVVHRSRCSWEH